MTEKKYIINKIQMSFKSFLLLAVSFFVLFNGVAQNKGVFKSDTTHSPRKATIYSAVLPGLGQLYNKKAWKIPIVYAAIGGCLTAAIYNGNRYQRYRTELIYRENNGGAMINYTNQQTVTVLENSKVFKKWRSNCNIKRYHSRW